MFMFAFCRAGHILESSEAEKGKPRRERRAATQGHQREGHKEVSLFSPATARRTVSRSDRGRTGLSGEEVRDRGRCRAARAQRARSRSYGTALDERVLEGTEKGQVRDGERAGVVGAGGAEGAEGVEPRLGPGGDRLKVGGDDGGEGEVGGDALGEAQRHLRLAVEHELLQAGT